MSQKQFAALKERFKLSKKMKKTIQALIDIDAKFSVSSCSDYNSCESPHDVVKITLNMQEIVKEKVCCC